MSIPVLSSGLTPAVDWLQRRLGFPKYLDHCTVPGWEAAYNLGTAYCRKIAGSSTWSQHAFGNALDIGIQPDDSPLGDEIYAWLHGPEVTAVLTAHGVSIAHALWKVPDHHNHIHVDFNPYGTGTPSCAGGPKGKVVQPWPLEEDDMTDTEKRQLAAVANLAKGYAVKAGFTIPPFKDKDAAAGTWEKVGQRLFDDLAKP